MKTYIAVGFKVNETRSVFYFKKESLPVFISKLMDAIKTKNPDFVSLRMAEETTD